MITSFFNKTKPINYVVVLGVISFFYGTMVLALDTTSKDMVGVFTKVVGLGFLWLTFFAVNPTLKADKLAQKDSYAMFFYALLAIAFISLFQNQAVIISNFLIVLSMDKTLALKFEKNAGNKIFEASLFVLLSSLLVPWSSVFVIPIFFAINVYCGGQIRLWLIPFAALTVFGMCALAVIASLGDWNLVLGYYDFDIQANYVFTEYYPLLVYIFLAGVVMVIVFIKLGNRGLGRILSLRILLAYFILSASLAIISSKLRSQALIFSFFPLTVFMTNYLETIRKKKFKEALLIFLAIAALSLAFFQLYSKVKI
ncbi:Hypothetical protein I595_2942 [Croceitalea dokdonensis DOKDO 023]|uniref:Uncharacterized protein n=1 Tax=Croceitalea dokdonensis DOKDO 023 TaxID=1300341 RepID=A0A0P7AFY5_9FLAO|nr:DUF6427 family protein [Croceitalea dokdonensis]KPM30963.1 Hypothetical protein I595_2942 [Croceitalea dokdonensis DOKDO 023]